MRWIAVGSWTTSLPPTTYWIRKKSPGCSEEPNTIAGTQSPVLAQLQNTCVPGVTQDKDMINPSWGTTNMTIENTTTYKNREAKVRFSYKHPNAVHHTITWCL